MMLRITSKWFCAAVELDSDGRVCRYAQLFGYMKFWDSERVLRYARIRKWTVEIVS